MAATNFSLNDYLIIDTTGSIGIGTTTPQARLFVTSSSTVTSQPGVVFKAGTANQLGGVGLVDVQNSSGTTLFFVSGSGRVGIGTNNPQQALHVSGDINVNSGNGIRINNTAGSGQFLRGDGTRFVSSGILAGDVPTLNQNTTGQAGSVANSATFNNGGAGAASGATFNGSSAVTISYNTIGAPSTGGTNATGTWGISITGNAGTATLLQTARNINGISFNGSADITVPVNTTQKSDNVSYVIPFVSSVTAGNQNLFTDSVTELTYNPSTNTLTTTTFAGSLSGNATSATTAGSVTNSVTFNNGGSGGASGTTFNGGSAVTVSYNTIGAPSTTGTNATGTWGISISGNAATATSATSAGSVTNSLTFSNAGSGDASGTTFNGSAARTISYNSIGAVGGSGTANYVSKFNASNTLANSQIFDNGTSVGIGLTTGLTARLYVSGSSTSSDQTVLFKAGTPNQTGPVLEVENNLGTTLLVVSGSGNVGIGTFNPSSKLHLSGGDLRFDSNATGIVYTTGATTNNVLKHNGTRFVPGTVAYSEVSGTPTIGDATLTVGVSGTGLSISNTSGTNTFTANSSTANTITITSNATSSNTVSTLVARDASGDFNAGRINAIIDSSDTRAVTTTPETLSRAGVVFDFKQNTSNGLSDGGGAGGYHGLMTFRQYGSGTDWTGGRSHQLGFTDNDNVWHRSGTSTTWGTWYRFYHTGNLTNPTTGTGTSGYIPRFNGTSSITNSIVFDDGTNVGIGTASSIAAKLHVFGGSLQVDNGTNNRLIALSDGGNIELSRSGGNAYIDLKSTSGADYDTRIQSAGEGSQAALTFHTNGAEKMRIAPSGSATVGIGTNNPLNFPGYGWLTLNGTAGSALTHQVNGSEQFRIQVDGVTYLNTIAAQPMVFMTSGAEVMRISSGGAAANVGIGTNNPAVKLHVRVTAPYDGIYQEGYSPTTTRWIRIFPSGSAGAFTPLVQQSDSAIIYGTTTGADLGSPGLVIGAWSNSRKGMRLDNNGNVGIGTETMSKKLVVYNSDALINDLTVGRGGTGDSTNSALGSFANSTVTSGVNNTAVGFYAHRQGNGSDNTAVGYLSMDNNTASGNTAVGVQSLYNVTSGPYNTAVGYKSLYSAGASNYSTAVGAEAGYGGSSAGRTAIGYQALAAAAAAYSTAVGYRSLNGNTTGVNNVGLGAYTLEANDTGANNTAIGANALAKLYKYDRNTAVGADAMATSTQGVENTSVGYRSLYSSNLSSYNVAVGSSALDGCVGNFNVGVGYKTLYTSTTGSSNVAIGSSALEAAAGDSNVAVGAFSLQNNTSKGNTAVGYFSLNSISVTSGSTAVGYEALRVATGKDNNALGWWAGRLISTGQFNVAVGTHSLRSVTTTSYSTSVGDYALELATGNGNAAFGYGAGGMIAADALPAGTSFTGEWNTLVGTAAGYRLRGIATGNVAVGNLALRGQDAAVGGVGASGSENVAVGFWSMLNASTGSFNTAVGSKSLASISVGVENVALGYLSLSNSTTGSYNVAVGSKSLYSSIKSYYNTAIGKDALYDLQTGYPAAADGHTNIFYGWNTAVGNRALRCLKDGYLNIGIGYNAGYYLTGSWNVVLGSYEVNTDKKTHHANVYIADGSGNLRIFVTGSNGNVGIGLTDPTSKLTVPGGSSTNIRIGEVYTGYAGITLNGGTANNDYNFLSATGDTNLYINRPTSRNIYFRENNNDQVVIEAGGFVGIGTNNPDYTLDVRGTTQTNSIFPLANNSYNIGYDLGIFGVRAYNSVYAYFYPAPSDYRLKENIREISGSLHKITKLRPVVYRYNDLQENVENLGDRVGFVAHELQEHFPLLVSGEKDDVQEINGVTGPKYQNIYQDDLVPYMVDAIKELKSENDFLKTEIQSLKDQISSILTMLSNK